MSLNFAEVRKLFPQIRQLDACNEVYLDSASTSLKFDFVIKSLTEIYEKKVSNVHRGEHHLSLEITNKYEKAREQVSNFLNASPEEIVFTRGTTEGVNLLSHALGENLKEGDEILITEMEHHSNFIPWQQLARKKNLKLKAVSVLKDGTLDMKSFEENLTPQTKIFSIIHVSNVTGVINPIEEMIKKARSKGIVTIVDAAQSASLLELDVQKIGCDFLVFSGHKIFAPSGIGALYGRKERLSELSPYQVGGGMILDVSLEDSTWAEIPNRFEAGTPFIEGAIALGEVLSFLKKELDYKEIFKKEKHLAEQTFSELSTIPNLKFIGSKENYSNIVSFIIEGFNSSDISFIMTKQKVAIRAGHHCCIPLMKKLNIPNGVVRASFSIYSRKEDIECLKKSVLKSIDILKGD